jgi:hypothetical protein
MEGETPAEIMMNDMDGTSYVLMQLPASEARRSLGVRTTPDGNNKQQVEYMRSIAEEWQDKIRTGHLTHYEAWTALTTRVMRTLLYAVAAMNLTEKQSAHIMAPILTSSLNAMGMQKYMPRVVVYGPLKYQGLDIPNLHTECRIAHIRTLLWECY